MARADRCWRAPLAYLDDPLHDRLRDGIQKSFGRQFSPDFFDEQFRRGLRGLLCYWLCSERELEGFMQSRQLELQGLYGIKESTEGDYHGHGPLPLENDQRAFHETLEWEGAQGGYPRVSATKLEYIKLLERADDLRTFPRFSALPAVVRSRFYDIAMLPRAMNDGADAVPQPPITMVSRHVRSESLPLFYQKQTLTVRLEHHGPTRQNRNGGFSMDQRMVRYLQSQSRDNLMRVRRITVAASLPVGRKVEGRKRGSKVVDCRDCAHVLCCEIDLDEEMVERQLVAGIYSKERGKHDDGQVVWAVLRVLRGVKNRVDGRLRAEDFCGLKDAVEWAAFSGAKPIVLQCCRS